MKNRIITIACVSTAEELLAACTAVYKNSDACEQLMRSKFAETSSDTLKIGHTGAGIDGSRVVVKTQAYGWLKLLNPRIVVRSGMKIPVDEQCQRPRGISSTDARS